MQGNNYRLDYFSTQFLSDQFLVCSFMTALLSCHERTAKNQTKLEVASLTPLTAHSGSQHRELKMPPPKKKVMGVFLSQSTAVSMAWSSRSQVWGHRIRDEASSSQRVTLEFKDQSQGEC